MKRMHKIIVCLVLMLHGSLYAQEPRLPLHTNKEAKPPLFASVPDQFEVSLNELQKIFAANLNEQISVQLSSQFLMEGKVVDKNQQNPGALTVNMRVKNYHNAIFNLTIRLLADNSTSIQGRILHPKYEDVLILFKDKDKYYIQKKSQRLFMPE